jgi:hypothetical protein
MEGFESSLWQISGLIAVFHQLPDSSKIVSLDAARPPQDLPSDPLSRNVAARDSWGRYADLEWSYYPDWYDDEQPWRGYIPKPNLPIANLWTLRFHGLDDPATRESDSCIDSEFHLLPQFEKELKTTSRDVNNVRSLIAEKYSHQPPPPELIDIDWSKETFASKEDFLDRIWDLRRSVLDIWGHATYCLMTDLEGWKSRIPDSQFQIHVERQGWFAAPKRGVFLRPKDMSFELTKLLLDHQVHVFYWWNDDIRPLYSDFDPANVFAVEYFQGNNVEYRRLIDARKSQSASIEEIVPEKSKKEMPKKKWFLTDTRDTPPIVLAY